MASLRWPVVVDALRVALAADTTLTGIVHDGIPVAGDELPAAVMVGVVVDEDTGDAGTFDQGWHELGAAAPRDDRGMIRCTVLAQRGDTDLAATRTEAFGLLAACEAVVRADPGLGVDGVLWCEVASGAVRQGQTPRGAYCEIEWRVTYRAVI